MKKNNYEKKGFSLMEIIIAVAVLGIVIISVCGVFLHGLDAIKKSKYRGCAVHIASQKFTELEEVDLGNNSGIPTDKISIPPGDGGYIEGFQSSAPDNVDFINWGSSGVFYTIKGKQSMEDIPYDFTITIENYGDNLKKITVEVFWREVEGDKKVKLCKLISRTM